MEPEMIGGGMAGLKQMDVEAGYAVVQAFDTSSEFIDTMLTNLRSAADNLLSTWNGNAKVAFESAWSDYTTQVSTTKQQLQSMREQLSLEVQQVEETFSA